MPMNIHAFARLLRARFLERLNDHAREGGLSVRFMEGSDATRALVGLHVLAPDPWDVEDALARADRDGHEVVFLYH